MSTSNSSNITGYYRFFSRDRKKSVIYNINTKDENISIPIGAINLFQNDLEMRLTNNKLVSILFINDYLGNGTIELSFKWFVTQEKVINNYDDKMIKKSNSFSVNVLNHHAKTLTENDVTNLLFVNSTSNYNYDETTLSKIKPLNDTEGVAFINLMNNKNVPNNIDTLLNRIGYKHYYILTNTNQNYIKNVIEVKNIITTPWKLYFKSPLKTKYKITADYTLWNKLFISTFTDVLLSTFDKVEQTQTNKDVITSIIKDNIDIFRQAFTSDNYDITNNYQAFEFVGDRYTKAIFADSNYRKSPFMTSNSLSQLEHEYLSENIQPKIMYNTNLAPFILSRSTPSDKMLEDVSESNILAIVRSVEKKFPNSGMSFIIVLKFIKAIFGDIEIDVRRSLGAPKTLIQEIMSSSQFEDHKKLALSQFKFASTSEEKKAQNITGMYIGSFKLDNTIKRSMEEFYGKTINIADKTVKNPDKDTTGKELYNYVLDSLEKSGITYQYNKHRKALYSIAKALNIQQDGNNVPSVKIIQELDKLLESYNGVLEYKTVHNLSIHIVTIYKTTYTLYDRGESTVIFTNQFPNTIDQILDDVSRLNIERELLRSWEPLKILYNDIK